MDQAPDTSDDLDNDPCPDCTRADKEWLNAGRFLPCPIHGTEAEFRNADRNADRFSTAGNPLVFVSSRR